MDSRLELGEPLAMEADEPLIRSRKDNIVCAAASAGALACGAAYYFAKAAGQPAWLAALEGALGITFLLAAGNANGDSQSWSKAISNVVDAFKIRNTAIVATLLAATVGYTGYKEQDELNARNTNAPQFMEPNTLFTKKSGEQFFLSWEVCADKNPGDRVDVSKYSYDKRHFHYTICPSIIR